MADVRLLTPRGQGAVAVLQLRPTPSSSDFEHVTLVDAQGRPVSWPDPECFLRARLCVGGEVLDDVIALGVVSGVELHVHGSPGVQSRVETSLLEAARGALGRRASSPVDGRQALHGPAPTSLRACRAWASARHGHVHALVAAIHEFLGGHPGGSLNPVLARRAQGVLAHARLADRLATAPTVRLVGTPNAGKSTLFNALLLEPRALVSPVAGTTRDTVSARIQLDGVELTLEDTEGGSAEEAKRPGADLLIQLVNSGQDPPLTGLEAGVAVLRVRGKADLAAGLGGRAHMDGNPAVPGVSGETGAGVPALRARISAALGLTGGAAADVLAPIDTAQRQMLRIALGLSVSQPPVRRSGNGNEKVR